MRIVLAWSNFHHLLIESFLVSFCFSHCFQLTIIFSSSTSTSASAGVDSAISGLSLFSVTEKSCSYVALWSHSKQCRTLLCNLTLNTTSSIVIISVTFSRVSGWPA